MAKKIKIVPLTKKDLAKATPAQRKLLEGAAKLVIKKAKKAKVALAAPKDESAAWTAADAELKKDAAKKKAKAAHQPSAVPVESHLPGVARNPKPPKVVKPLAADGSLVPLKIISYHFLKLMERLAAEHGGTSAQALEDLKADIAKRKPT